MSSEIVFFLHDPDLDVSYDDVIPMVETVDIYLEESVEDLHQEEEFEDKEEEVKTEIPNDVVILTHENKEIPKETACEPLVPVPTNSQENLEQKQEILQLDEPVMTDESKELKEEIPKDEPVMTAENKELKRETPKDERIMADENEELKETLKDELVMTDQNKEMTREIINELKDKVDSRENLEISNSINVIEVKEKKRSFSNFSMVRKFVSHLTLRKKVNKVKMNITGSEFKVTDSSGPQSHRNRVKTETKADDDVTFVSPDQHGTDQKAVSKTKKSVSRRILDGMFCFLRMSEDGSD